jgi:hypothetical protein
MMVATERPAGPGKLAISPDDWTVWALAKVVNWLDGFTKDDIVEEAEDASADDRYADGDRRGNGSLLDFFADVSRCI